MNERRIARDLIIKVLEKGCFISDVISTLSGDVQKNGYIRRTLKGTCERKIELDCRINLVSKIKINKMHPEVRNTLRLGAYELLYMESIPQRATVNEMVNLIKHSKNAKAAGLVNALLRQVEEDSNKQGFDEYLKSLDTTGRLSAAYSIPQWLVSYYISVFGEKKSEEIFILKSYLLQRQRLS